MISLSGSHNIDKYILPIFIDVHIITPMIFTNRYCRNIINNCKKLKKFTKIDITLHHDFRYDHLTLTQKACYENNSFLLKLLIKLGADVNYNKSNFNPLSIVCFNGYLKCTKILIKNNADVNNIDVDKGTALHSACLTGHSECVALLLNANVDINIKTKFGKTALDYAIQYNKVECINLLKNKITQ
jgi:ankyrin repeat protein